MSINNLRRRKLRTVLTVLGVIIGTASIVVMVSLGIGLVLAFLCTMGMRAQLKSVRTQDSAVDYVRQGSMALTRSNDIFLYHTVTKTAKPKDSDSSSGGSDSDHGGTGGSF